MVIAPNTNLYLVKVPIEIDNKNQLTFANKQAQLNYFMSCPHTTNDDFTYQRKDGIIRFPTLIDNIYEYNYCVYQNESYSDKYFYAFITGMRYVNDNMTEISIATDVWQTWQFDIWWKESFIEREMIISSEDTPGANLLPEGLEIGELINFDATTIDDLEPINIIAFTGDKIASKDVPQTGFKYNGIFSSITFIVTNILKDILEQINEQGDGDKIFTVFTVPKLAVKDILPTDLTVPFTENLTYNFTQSPINIILNNRPANLNGYVPHNNKLLTYPYCYFGFNPANGSQKIFRYEDFNGTPIFKVISEINPNPSVCFIPQNYKNLANNVAETVNLGGYPTISYKNDYFNTWLAQNSEIIQLQMNQEQFNYEVGVIQDTTNSVGGIINKATKGDVSAITDGINLGFNTAKADVNHEYYIKNQMAQIEKQKLLPDTANLSSSNATLLGYNQMKENIFTNYCIKQQYAERIDKFFDCYGYLTNKVKVPNLNNRPNWNYVKTIGANIEGYIPQNDLQLIKDLFNNGITLWHNPETFLDYSKSNWG